jgi:branched-chain amino acid transport system substrate-binding protein
MYTYYAGVSGTPTALGTDTAGKVRVVAYGGPNMGGVVGKLQDEFKAKFNDDWYTYATYNGLSMLAHGMAKARSTDPVKVAAAMSGLSFPGFGGEVTMRKQDHQLQQGMFITSWEKVDAKNRYNVENTGMTFVEVKKIEPYVASTPTSCQMQRP